MTMLCMVFNIYNIKFSYFALDGDHRDLHVLTHSFPTRRSSDLTFVAGIHRCIGASLARMELRVAAEEIIRRLDHIKLTIPVEEISYLPSLATHTIERLPLSFSRRR